MMESVPFSRLSTKAEQLSSVKTISDGPGRWRVRFDRAASAETTVTLRLRLRTGSRVCYQNMLIRL
jgi:hypothetical protein